MLPVQVEQLRKDSRELDHWIQRLKKEGRMDKASRLMKKREFIEAHIESIETDDVRMYI